MNKYRRRGFTLIELLLVLVILATLATIVVPKFTKRSLQAKITTANTQITNLSTAINNFEIDNTRFPTTSEGLRALVEKPANADRWKMPYMDKGIPKDPWGNEYVYKQPGTHNEYGFDLSSAGPDGIVGNDNDITNWSEDD